VNTTITTPQAGQDQDARALLDGARGAGLSHNAYALYAAIVVYGAAQDWVTCSALAELRTMSNHEARIPLGELVRAGLLTRRRLRGPRVDGGRETTLVDYRLTAVEGGAR
jgi:hypothetical protein